MEKVTICQITVDDLFDHHDAPSLLAEYGAESSIYGLPAPKPDQEIYRLLERSGALHVMAAFQGDTMLGFLALIVSANPHYSTKLAATESYFVGADYRKTGAGLKLRKQAEELATMRGAKGFLISAPASGKLADVMASDRNYRETNRVFFRSLA